MSVENNSEALISMGKQLLKGQFEDKIVPGQVIKQIAHARIVQHKPFVLDGSYFEVEKKWRTADFLNRSPVFYFTLE